MASAGTVTLELDANSVKLIRELQKAQKQTKRSTNTMAKDASKAFASMRKNAMQATKFILGIGTAMAAAGTQIFRVQSRMMDELAKTSDALGIQQERLQALQMVADLTGTSANQLSTNMERMQRRLGEVARNGGQAERALAEIGVPIQDIINMKPDEQLEMLSKALAGVENQAVKASIANDLFGRDGVRMLKLMEQLNTQGLQPVVDELESMGVALTRLDTAKVERARDELAKAREVAQVTARQFTIGISTAVATLSNMFVESRKGADSIADSVEEILTNAIIGTIRLSATVGRFLEPIKAGIKSIWEGFLSLPAWVKEIGLLGAIVFGRKGQAALIGLSAANSAIRKMGEEVDKIAASLFQAAGGGFVSNLERVPKRIGMFIPGFNLATGVSEEESQGSDFSLIGSLFGGESEQKKDWDEWADQKTRQFRETMAEIKRDVEQSATPRVSPVDLILGDDEDDGMAKLTSGLNSIVNATRTQIERINADIETVQQAIDNGITAPFEEAGTTGEEVLKRLNERLKELGKTGEETGGMMSEFAKSAAQNMQSSFADFLFDPFDKGIKGMLKGFIDMIRQMVAQAMAATILQSMFGGLALSTNPVAASFGAAFGGIRDTGGRGSAGKAYVINPKAGPEVFIPDTAGEFIPNIDDKMGGGGINLTIDARDAGAEARIKDMIMREMVPQIITAAKSETINTIRRPRFA